MSSNHHLAGLFERIERYYSKKVLTHGATALGVDWGCVLTQEFRFVQLLRLCDFNQPFSLNDLGCGYGALLAFLRKRHRRCPIDYLGIDLSEAMIGEAERLWDERPHSKFVVGSASPRVADYSVASGIFNVQQNESSALWTRFIEITLTNLNATSRRGFAVNFLDSGPIDMDPRPGLYQVDPEFWTAYCKHHFHRKTELIAGYGMREFTLIVRD